MKIAICNCESCVKLRTPKPLAQYLDEYIEHEANIGNIDISVAALEYTYNSWRELLEQALDAYESTENVVIQIIKKKVK